MPCGTKLAQFQPFFSVITVTPDSVSLASLARQLLKILCPTWTIV